MVQHLHLGSWNSHWKNPITWMSWRSLLELAPLLPVTRYPIIVHPSIRWGKAECFSLCHADRWWEPIIDLIHNLWISVSRPWHVLFRGETSEDKLFSVFDLARIRGKDSPAESWTNGQLFIKKSQRVKLCSTFWQLSPAPATNLGRESPSCAYHAPRP